MPWGGYSSLILFLALQTLQSWAALPPSGRIGPSDPNAGIEACQNILRQAQGSEQTVTNLLQQTRSAPIVRVSLPYRMTTAYSVNLNRVNVELPGVDAVYLSYADDVQVIPIKTTVESWHNFIKRLDGYHLTLTFSSAEARAKLFEKIGYRATVWEGTACIDGAERFIMALTPQEYALAQLRLGGPSTATQSQPRAGATPAKTQATETGESSEPVYVTSTRLELEALSDSSERTARPYGHGTRYFFKGTTIIGFEKNGKYFKYKRYLDPATLDFASHYNILKRQGVSLDPQSIPVDPQAQFRMGRENLEAALKFIAENTKLAADERSAAERLANDAQSSAIVKLKVGQSRNLANLLNGVLKYRMRLFKIQLQALAGEVPIADLARVSDELNDLREANPGSTRYVRFIWIRGTDASYAGIVRVDGSVLHDQMAVLALGHELVDDASFARDYLRGGLLKISYGQDGKAATVRIVDGKITVPAGPTFIEEQEAREVEQGILKALR